MNPRDNSVIKHVGMHDDHELIAKYAQRVLAFVSLTRSVVRDLDPLNDLTFLRLRSKQHEIIVAPEWDFVFMVVQDYHISTKEELAKIKVKPKERPREPQDQDNKEASEGVTENVEA